jgi:hypothetical protein
MSTYKQPQKVANPTEEPKRMPAIKDWTPIKGVSIGKNEGVKTSGIKMRGTGAATKGLMSRGPMA